MDDEEMFDLDNISEIFNNGFFCNIESQFPLDFDASQLGFIGVDQCENPLDLTHSCKIQMTSCKAPSEVN
jgi:hypothetical protein